MVSKSSAGASALSAVSVMGVGRDVSAVLSAVLSEVRENYGFMQRSWFIFAKSIHAVYLSKIYEEAKYDSFREYVEKEFPSICYQNVMKLIGVVDVWGDILETKLKKDGDYLLPSYESCSMVISAEKKKTIPREEISKIKKAVLDNKMSNNDLRETLKSHLSKDDDKRSRTIDVDTMEEVENQLTQDLRRSGEFDDEIVEADFDEVEDFEVEEDEEEEGDFEDSSTDTEKALMSRVEYLLDNLPAQTKTLKKTISDGTVHLAENLEKLMEVIDIYLERVQEVGEVS